MLESIARQGQYNHYSKRSIQSAGNQPVSVRSAFMLSAAFVLLTASSLKSEAEEAQQNSGDSENSSQVLIGGFPKPRRCFGRISGHAFAFAVG